MIPVEDVDRAKRFYEQLGWRVDADFLRSDGSRAVQLTPPGSPSSIHLGDQPVLFLVVSDIEAARAELAAHGVDVSEVFHRGKRGRVNGPDPERRSYGSLATLAIRTATAGCFRKSLHGCPDEWMQISPRSPRRASCGGTQACSGRA